MVQRVQSIALRPWWSHWWDQCSLVEWSHRRISQCGYRGLAGGARSELYGICGHDYVRFREEDDFAWIL